MEVSHEPGVPILAVAALLTHAKKKQTKKAQRNRKARRNVIDYVVLLQMFMMSLVLSTFDGHIE